jgi:hypothetical protein
MGAVSLLGAGLCAMPAVAAEVYIQPSASLTAENDSNLDLQPGPNPEVQGYVASAASLFGISTPSTDTTIRPRLEYRDYPKDTPDNRLEEYLDLKSEYRGSRSDASILGTVDHRDDFNAEFSSALYNDFNPVQPTAPQTGKAVTGVVRDSVLVLPQYEYNLSPLWNVGVSGIYQGLRYHPTSASFLVDFNYYQGKGFVSWAAGPRSQISLGAYGSNYQATQIDSQATGAGGSLDLDTKWTPLLATNFSAVYQRTNVYQRILGGPASEQLNTEVNLWGATFGAVYKGQVAQYRFNIGRIITPSGGGGIYVNDQAQFQYDRNLTQRLSFTGAMLLLRNRGVTSNVNGDDRDYLQTVVELKWMWSPTWFVQGGYQYAWQKFEYNPDGAANNRIYIRVGYLGLPRQR